MEQSIKAFKELLSDIAMYLNFVKATSPVANTVDNPYTKNLTVYF